MLLLISALHGCTAYRIVRWQVPSPDVHRAFPERVTKRADEPFSFVKGAQRGDLDTVLVRDVDAVMRPFGEYFVRRRILAFLVIRNDTVLYERYSGGYTSATRPTVFSVSKSLISPLVGLALQRGAIRSLDDEVVRYLPELAGKTDFKE